ncbi:hypothetical protein Tco_1144814 [Tanacetum coccineum]
MLAIPHHSQVFSMAEIDSKEAQKKLKAGICFRITSHNKHTWFLLSPKKHKLQVQEMKTSAINRAFYTFSSSIVFNNIIDTTIPPNLVEPPKDTMADNRTMANCSSSTEGLGRNCCSLKSRQQFEIKHGLLTLVQNSSSTGHDKEDPHGPHPLSEQRVLMSRLVRLGNRFQKIFSEHGPHECGNFLDKRPADCSSIIESKSKVRHSQSKAIVAKLYYSRQADNLQFPAPAPVKAVEAKLCYLRVLPSNTVLTQGELKSNRHQSGVFILMDLKLSPPVVEVETEVTKDTVLPNRSTKDVQPPIVQVI